MLGFQLGITYSLLVKVAQYLSALFQLVWRIASRVWLIVALTVLLLRAIGSVH